MIRHPFFLSSAFAALVVALAVSRVANEVSHGTSSESAVQSPNVRAEQDAKSLKIMLAFATLKTGVSSENAESSSGYPIGHDPIMDPGDPSTWVNDFSPSGIESGPIMDPSDPDTWVASHSVSAAISVHDFVMNPHLPSTWDDNFDPSSVDAGVMMDPDNPNTWQEPLISEPSDGGEVLNPNDPSTWR